MYRHQKGDLRVDDGRELKIKFEKIRTGDKAGLWGMTCERK
jgi:hypothetical protein